MKLLIVASVPIHLHTFWRPYARYFRAKGWQVDGGAANIKKWEPTLLGDFDHLIDIPFIRDPVKAPHKLPGQLSCLRKIRQLTSGYDILHVNTPMAAFMTRLAWRKRQNRPAIVYTAHGFHFFKGNHSKYNSLFYFLEKTAARWTDLLLTMNQDDYAAACAFGSILQSRVKLIPGIGVDPSVYKQPSQLSIKEKLGLKAGDKLVTSIAELIPRKGHSDLLAAMELQPDNVHLALVGNGRLTAQLKALVEEKGLASRVHFTGFQQNVPEWIASSDVLVLCSKHEGLPRCILEGMSIGTPVIASDVRGSRDLLKDGSGWLYQPGQISQLSDLLTFVLTPANKENVMAHIQKAKEAIPQYSQANLLTIHEQLYTSCFAL